jgi:hypothetical protein
MNYWFIATLFLFCIDNQLASKKMTRPALPKSIFYFLILVIAGFSNSAISQEQNSSVELVNVFKEWRLFENAPLRDGAPDYTEQTFTKRNPFISALTMCQSTLLAIDQPAVSIECSFC